MPRSGPRAVRRYSDEFKLTAVHLSHQPGIQVKTVARALAIHPFMLSKWRKDAREGRLRGRARKAPPAGPAREIAQLQSHQRSRALSTRGDGQGARSPPKMMWRSKSTGLWRTLRPRAQQRR